MPSPPLELCQFSNLTFCWNDYSILFAWLTYQKVYHIKSDDITIVKLEIIYQNSGEIIVCNFPLEKSLPIISGFFNSRQDMYFTFDVFFYCFLKNVLIYFFLCCLSHPLIQASQVSK